jgi:predicted permease
MFFCLGSPSAYPVTVQCQHTGMVKKMLVQFTSQTTYYLLATSPQHKLGLIRCYNYSMLAYLLFSNKENV